MKPDDPDDLLDGILKVIEGFESKHKPVEGQPAPSAVLPGTPAESGFRLRLFKPSSDFNPEFPKGVQAALLEPDMKLETLTPAEFTELPEVEMNSVVAIRDTRRKVELTPGENLVSRAVAGGRENYIAKVRGRVVLIGNVIHLLPSDVDGKVLIQMESGNAVARIDIYPARGNGRPADWETTQALFEKGGIKYGILESAVREALQACVPEGHPVLGVTAARGLPPIAGKPGDIEYLFDREYQGPLNLEVDSEGKIDFHNVKWIPVVQKDQLLARVTPAVPGTDGVDVLGNPIPARQPPKLYLVAGKNVRAEKDETEFYSEINGCVQLNGSLLDVMNVFVVNSDVDFHTGNVNFEGNVLITGSVHKGFHVEASGDVVVLKNVEPSGIKAGRDVFIHGGVLGGGRGPHRVEAGRNITAGYAENAWLEAQGDIRIEDFCMQSFLYSCGRVVLESKRGSIIGGESMAAKSVEAKSLGSPSGVKTVVAAGIDFVRKRQQAHLKKQSREIQEATAKIDRYLKSLLELTQKGTLPPSKVETIKTIIEKRKLMAKALHATMTRIQELDLDPPGKDPPWVRVTEVIHPEVLLTLRGIMHKVVETNYRSRFRLNEKGDHILRGTT